MEGSVVEGISTSLPSCPLFSQPHGSQSLFAPEDLPTPPSYHDVHVNDLGLTPPPGSQLLQPTNVTRPNPLHDEHGSSNGDVRISMASQPAGSSHDDQTRGSRKGTPDDPSLLRRRRSSNNEVGPSFPDGPAASPVGSIEVATNAAAQTRPPQPLSSNITPNADDLLYDPLFGPDFVLPNFDTNPSSLKRTADEALADDFHLWHRPEKRLMPDSLQRSSAPSLDATPSLSSPDTIQLDHFETVPNTPGGIADSQLPAPPFDPFDSLFEDPAFHIPSDLSGIEYSSENRPAPHSADAEPSYDASRLPSFNVQVQAADPVTFDYETEGVSLPTSELTKRQFSLDTQDVLANADRETLQRVDHVPKYTSPYPMYHGPLGYLPSAPGIHVKCIQIANDQVNARFSHLKYKIQQLKYERDKYRDAWSKWTTLEASTGKSRAQILEEENATLRRVSTQHQRRAEQYKQEIEVWKGRLHDLSVIYNNLLYEIQVQKRLPAVAPIPRGYRPRYPPQAAATHSQSVAPGQQLASTPYIPVPHQNPPPSDSPPSGITTGSVQHPSPAEPQPETVTIDLTDEASNITPNPASIAPSKPMQESGELLQSLQKKKYNWLETAKSGSAQPAVARAGPRPPLRPESAPRASQQPPAPRSSSNQQPSIPHPEIQAASRTNHDDEMDVEDDLLHEMEEELARG